MLELEIPPTDFLLIRSVLDECDIWIKYFLIVALLQLLFMPVYTDLSEFQALSFGDQLVFPFTCNDVRESVPQSSSASLTEFCRNITILINAALFNGALSMKTMFDFVVLN